MSNKIIATLMVLLMAASAIAICAPAGSDATEGDAENPYYLAGNSATPAQLYEKDQDGQKTEGLKAKIDFNQAAYSIKDDEITFETSVNGGNYSKITLGTAKNVGHTKVTITENDDIGVYDVKIAYRNSGSSDIRIKISFETYFDDKVLELEYYYAANVRAIAGSQSGDNPDGYTIAVEGVDVITKDDGSIDYLKVLKGAVPEFVLKVYDPTVSTVAPRTAIMDTYSFYASGLPEGLAVKVDKTDDHEFVITGKVDHSITVNDDGYHSYPLVINAADYNGNILAPLEVEMRVYLSDVDFIFEVETVNDEGQTETKTMTGDGSAVIKAGTPISVTPKNADGSLNTNVKVFYTGPDGKKVPIEGKDGKYTYQSQETDSGVVEIVMSNTVGNITIQHKVTTLIVGNVVHSGLDPVVTSS